MVDPVSDPAPDSGPDSVSDSGSDSGPDSGIAPVSAPVHFDPATLVYNPQGLIPAIAQEEGSNAVLMMAWMNAASLARTLASGRVTYWSRSRRAFWTKGETSGHGQELVELRIDCDRDCLLLIVRQRGPACHTRRKSCFYTGVRAGAEVELMAPLGPDAAETGPPQRP